MSGKKNELNLKFTGRMTVALELENYDEPIEFIIDDVEIVKDITTRLLDLAGNTFTVTTHPKKDKNND
jgi:hypothetical protein